MARRRIRTNHVVVIGVVLACIIAGVLFLLYSPSSPLAEPEFRDISFRCLVDDSGVIPIKAVAINDLMVRTGTVNTQIRRYHPYYVFEETDDKVLLGKDPFDDHTLGWADKDDVLLWNSNLGLRPDFDAVGNADIYLWKRLQDVGDIAKQYCKMELEGVNLSKVPVLPVLNSKSGCYRIAAEYYDDARDEHGVEYLWILFPQERMVDFYFYTSREELRQRIKQMKLALNEILNQEHRGHPIVRLMRENLGLTLGWGVDLEDMDGEQLQEMAATLPSMPGLLRMRPEEIRDNAEALRQDLLALQRFADDSDNWDQDIAWVPLDLLPGN